MHEGKNMGIMIALKKNLLQKGGRPCSLWGRIVGDADVCGPQMRPCLTTAFPARFSRRSWFEQSLVFPNEILLSKALLIFGRLCCIFVFEKLVVLFMGKSNENLELLRVS
jgi:hypothetical protein